MRRHILLQLLLFFSFILLPQGANGQGIISFTSDGQLSSTTIRSLMEDSYKNIWITTYNGLNRYDGTKMNIYHQVEGEEGSLLHDITSCTCETSSQGVLIGTGSGVQRYDRQMDQFEYLPLIGVSGDTVPAHVVRIVECLSGRILASTAGLGVYEWKDGAFHELQVEGWPTHDAMGRSIYLYADSHGRLWVSDYDGRIFCDAQLMGRLDYVVDFCESSSGTVYVGTIKDGLWRYDEMNSVFESASVNGDDKDWVLTALHGADEGHIFVCTDGNGLQVFDERSGTYQPADIRTYEYDFTTSNVKDAIVDSYGNIWAGVYWKEVVVQPASSSPFQYIGRRSSTRNLIGSNCVTAMAPAASPEGCLWVATDHNGIYRVRTDGSSSEHFQPSETSHMPSTVMSILEDSRGNVWLGSSVDGVFLMNRDNGRCTPLSSLATGIDELRNAWHMVEDGYHDIWLATVGSGIYRLHFDKGRWTAEHYGALVDHAAVYPDHVLSNLFVNVLLLHDGRLFAGTSDGLEVFRFEGRDLRCAQRLLPGIAINDLKVAPDGTLRMATNTGLYVLGMNAESVTISRRITVADGLNDNRVTSLVYGKDGSLWAGTDGGLSCVGDDTIRTFTAADGLQNNEFTERTALIVDDQLWFGGTGGLTSFRANGVGLNTSSATTGGEVRITELYHNGQTVHVGDKSGRYTILDRPITVADKVEFNHRGESFVLELSVMNVGVLHPHFFFRINGGEWARLGEQQRSLSFTGLNPGRYRIEVKEESCPEVRSLNVVIHQAWYSSWVAILCYLLLLTAIVLLVLNLRHQSRAARNAEEEHRKEVERVKNMEKVELLAVRCPDDELMNRVMKVINAHLSDPEVNVEYIAAEAGLSRVHFYRKMKEITDMTPHDFIKTVRLKEAARLLSEQRCDITDVSIATGFRSLSAFSTSFKAYYGKTPSQFMKEQAKLREGNS